MSEPGPASGSRGLDGTCAACVPGGPGQRPTPIGFDILEGLFREHRDLGRSPILDRWTAQVRQRLAEFREQHPGAVSLLRQAALVERAFDLAIELVEQQAAARRSGQADAPG